MSEEWRSIPNEQESQNHAMYLDTTEYKLIYIYWIDDDAHKGLLKIGDASIKTEKLFDQLPNNCSDLNKAAKKRIGIQTGTAGIMYHLVHTEIAVRQKGRYLEAFRDKAVHSILERSGIRKVTIPVPGAKATEWFQVDLDTAKNAITVCKLGRKTLFSSEIVPEEEREIVLREEQEDAIKKTINCFKTDSQMLWNAKMRYGKTATSLTFVKRELAKYPKTIIITHRPVVESGWREDFNIVFRHQKCLFLTKDKESDDSDESALIDLANEKQLKKATTGDSPFIYFASIQDLRGSKRVGGKYDKNNAVFDLNWDLVINDEAHEGTQTELGLKVSEALKKPHTKLLSLSGTPFNIINQFDDDSVYTWDYPMEQARKREWDSLHPGDPNPYADLPQMHIYTYDLGDIIRGYSPELEDKAFNFTEFFRTYTRDSLYDEKTLPNDALIGEFVHKNDVKHFLNLLTTPSEDSAYPFSTPKFRDLFRHTLWMVPGVKEALALEKMLREHPIFKNFKVANVAGEGDFYEEVHYDNALEKVLSAIKENDYTITLSCGKLTTGVTVREWTACFMLSGSYVTGASSYLQTIFRVQSPGQINGKIKEHSYVFDFAPDRTLVVLAEAAKVSRKGGSGGNTSDERNRNAMRNFLNFCPVVAISGTKMKPYSVDSMMEQLKKVYAERAIRTGFDDASIYNERLLTLDSLDIKEFEELKKIIGSSRAQKLDKRVVLNDQGFTEEEYEQQKRLKKKSKIKLTDEEREKLANLKKQKEERGKAISILRGISVRMPLLIYGADVPFEEDISIERFVDLIDNDSWLEFMPTKVTKELFQKFSKYYDRDVFVAAGKEIRRLAKRADTMLPTQRIQSIANIFSYFKNPDKETVLTPWRVVNLHMSGSLGGYDFWNEDHNETIEEPRFVDRGDVTAKTLSNTEAKILEINSKTGLYPLYVAYSIYRSKCKEYDGEFTESVHQELWEDTVKNNVFIICKTKMAKHITKRTLIGYKTNKLNAHYFDDLINQFKNKPDQVVKKLLNKKKYWNFEGIGDMKFNAIVGNPPYQMMDRGNGVSAGPIYNCFIDAAKALDPDYISMITPSRWFAGGKGLDVFRETMLNDSRTNLIFDFDDAKECFPTADIAGGINYFLWDKTYQGVCHVINFHSGENVLSSSYRPLNEFETLIRYSKGVEIVRKVNEIDKDFLIDMVSSRKPFGFPTNYSGRPKGEFKVKTNKGYSYCDSDDIASGKEMVAKWKVITSKVSYDHAGSPGKDGSRRVLSILELLEPNTICTETYLVVLASDDKTEAENAITYLQTKFCRLLIVLSVFSQDITKDRFRFVPIQDFSEPWSDEKLYEKYSLTQDEIAFIEKMVKPMELT